MTTADEILEWLRDPKTNRRPAFSYSRGIIGLVEQLTTEFLVSDAAARERMSSLVMPEFSYVFFMYSRHAATHSVREKSPELLKRGVISLAIEDLKFDWRDSTIHLAVLNHSALRLGLEPDVLFESILPIVSEKFVRFLRGFVARSAEERSIDLFGVQESDALPFDYQPLSARQLKRQRQPGAVSKLIGRVRHLFS